ncbi:MAG: acetaldehyde dehydrogenase (acetylating) [Olegusella sp.]|nr:acetaldehyde dehydrogenase (acetylating) [Olegusella sp.]
MEEYDYDLKSIQAARDLARKGKIAANQLATFNTDQIDRILRSMVDAAEKNVVTLAKMAVEETSFGNVHDKIYKNHMASGLLYEGIKDKNTIGIIDVDEKEQVITVAEPLGLLLGIVPSTNPTSTVFYKSMIAIKSRNAIVFSPHPKAAKCTNLAIKIMEEAAVKAGAPENVIQGITLTTIAATNELMHAPEVDTIIATGGPGMVKAAYSSGKPALGVGAGNSPSYIERTANVSQAVKQIIASKTFDYGTICASEQSVICETCNRDEVIAEFQKQGGYFMSKEECNKVCKLLFRNGHAMSPNFVGHSPQSIAEAAGIVIPEGTKVLIGEQYGVGDKWPLSFEKLTTVLGFYTVTNWEEACDLCIQLLQNGIGHTLNIHTEDKEIVRKFSVKPASRILINTGGTQGGTGLSTGLNVALTLGCGSWGGSSISENVGPEHLINIKRVANGIIEPDKVAELDESFARYHPELIAEYTNCGPSTDCKSSSKDIDMPVGSHTPDHYYSLGCNACGSKSVPDESKQCSSTDGIDADELKKMVTELVTAFRGTDK